MGANKSEKNRLSNDHSPKDQRPKDQRPRELSAKLSDEVKNTTCYMCACRCGINVHLRDGEIRYIEGNRNHPVNKGVLCAKGSAGIMNQLSPARLSNPLMRVGPRGSGEFKEISWDEALSTATQWLSQIRNQDPKKLAFFTGRDQSQGLTGWWAQQFGTPNYAAHGGFCSVNMATAGLYTIGGSFWEFGEPDWDKTKYFMMFGIAEDHDSNPIKMGLGKIKERGAKFISVNPVRTGYSSIADEWLGIKPGTDGMFVGSLIYELMRMGKIDAPYLARYTNSAWLVIENPGAENHGLFLRDEQGQAKVFDQTSQSIKSFNDVEVTPAMHGSYQIDGMTVRPSFEYLAKRFLSEEYSPKNASEICGISAKTIRRIACELAEAAFEREVIIDQPWVDWLGRKHDKMIGRPVSMHAMRGISAHSNGFHTCRMIHILQLILGSVDTPGGFLYKAPFPKPCPPPLKPHGKPDQVKPNTPMAGPPLGFTQGPEDLIVDDKGQPCRIDKAFSWEAPMSSHGMMHMVIANAAKGDPYKIDLLFMYMANMGWNSSMNVNSTLEALTAIDEETGEYKIPKFIYSDAFHSETIAYADLILPDTTYLERYDCISLLDRPISSAEGPADAIRQPIVEPDRNVRPFQDVLIDLGARLGLPGLTNDDGQPKYPEGYKDYIVNHERTPGVGPLAGFRGKDGDKSFKGDKNPDQLKRYIENGCFWQHHLSPDQQYYRFANRAYLDWAADEAGLIGKANPIIMQIYSEPLQKFRLAGEGIGPILPPVEHRERIATYCDPLPMWYPPFEGEIIDQNDYPMHAITQRPMAMYHSWGSQNAWLRQIHASNRLYIHRNTAEKLNLKDDDWVWITSHVGRVRGQVQLAEGVEESTVWTWNAIGKRRGAWGLDADAPEGNKGFLLNHVIHELLPPKKDGYRYSNSDPVTGQAAWYDLRVRIEKCNSQNNAVTAPLFETVKPLKTRPKRKTNVNFGEKWRSK